MFCQFKAFFIGAAKFVRDLLIGWVEANLFVLKKREHVENGG